MLFFVNGATFSNWLPRVPEIRDRLGLDNAGLGATLLGGGLGGIVGSLLVGRISTHLGSRRQLVVAASLLSIGLPCIALAPAGFIAPAAIAPLAPIAPIDGVIAPVDGVIAPVAPVL